MNTSLPAFATIAMVILLALVTTALAGFVGIWHADYRRLRVTAVKSFEHSAGSQ